MNPARWQRELDGRDAYEILGLAPTATVKEIGQAKRIRMKDAHPDAGGSEYLAALVSRAADILADATQRREYDRWRTAGSAPADEPSLWDDADQGFAAAPAPPSAPPAATAYRGTTPPRPPGPVPGAGPGSAPMYGSPHVMPHIQQPPPQYYHQPGPPRSRAGLVMLIIGGGVLLVCLGMCFLNALVIR
jgi:curved DNA-binding protein CbpA